MITPEAWTPVIINNMYVCIYIYYIDPMKKGCEFNILFSLTSLVLLYKIQKNTLSPKRG